MKRQKQLEVSYRDLAKVFAKHLPVEGQEFTGAVEQYLNSIKRLPKVAKIALKTAYIWSAKVPREEREDFFQELILAVLQARVEDERLAYAICRCDWQDFWRRYKLHSQFNAGSLNEAIANDKGEAVEWGELLVGEVDMERRIDGDIDGHALYEKLPSWVKALVDKRLMGLPIRGGDRILLDKWVSTRPLVLADYQN